jgi:hypothetical protein
VSEILYDGGETQLRIDTKSTGSAATITFDAAGRTYIIGTHHVRNLIGILRGE